MASTRPVGSQAPNASDTAAVGDQFFSRKSSGLVREMSFSANLAITMLFMSPPLAMLTLTGAPSAITGANPLLANLMAFVVCLVPATLWSYFLSVMPRSGGDYVFVSRALHPWVGFAANFSFVCWVLIAAAVLAQQVATFGVSSGLAVLGAATDSQGLLEAANDVTSKGWQFGLGSLTLISTGILLCLSLQTMLRVMKVLLGFCALGLLIALAIVIFNDRGDFEAAVAANGGNYHQIVSAATHFGFEPGKLSLSASLLAVPLAFAAFGYSFLGVYAGGEVRSPRSSGRRAIFAAVAVFGLLVIPLTALSSATFGNDFLGAATVLSNEGSAAYPFAAPSFPFFFYSMLAGSNVLIVIMNLAFIVSLMALGPPTFLIASRSLFAWSFDRVVPTKLSQVSPRTGTPILANAVITLVTLVFLAVAVFASSSLLDLLFSAGMAQQLTFIVLGIAGIVFPFRHRRIYDASPFRKYIGRVPVMSIVAAGATAVWAFIFITWATVDELGAATSAGWTAVAVIGGIGILVYPISYLVNRMRGVDLSIAVKQLPPE